MSGRRTKRTPGKAPGKRTKGPAGASFRCCQCDAVVGSDSDRCPGCGAFYIRGLKDEDVDELSRAELLSEEPSVDFVEAHRSSTVQFDADIDIMSLLDDGITDPGFVSECSHCGTVVELSTSRCPICGTPMEHLKVGLVDMFTGMEFDPEPFDDADCPYCGEHVRPRAGDCPSCGKAIGFKSRRDPDMKVKPVLRDRDVVFIHLDIDTGDISVLRRDRTRHRYDQGLLHLNGAEDGSQGRAREGLPKS